MRDRTVLVIGACGAIGRTLVRSYCDEGVSVIGVDPRGWRGIVPDGLRLHRIGLNKRPFEDVFRTYHPDAVVHVGLVSTPRMGIDARYENNVVGMQRVVRLCGDYDVRRLVVLSRGSVYGADLRNPVRLTEDAPLRGASHNSDLRDIVEADILAQSLSMRQPKLSAAILRPANVVGARVRNTMVGYLRLPVIPVLLGFDPLVQLIHEDDLINAIKLAVTSDAPGVFNIAGAGEAPLSVTIRESGGTSVPVLHPFFRPIVETLWRRGLSPAPMPHVDFLRYNCLLDDGRARAAFGYAPERSMAITFEAVRSRSRYDEGLTDMFRTTDEGDLEFLQP
jgi:UDP-glucose 4-epimerase